MRIAASNSRVGLSDNTSRYKSPRVFLWTGWDDSRSEQTRIQLTMTVEEAREIARGLKKMADLIDPKRRK